MNKKTDFLKLVSLFIIITFIFPMTYCSKSSDDETSTVITGGNCLVNGIDASIGSNHGHTISIPTEDIDMAVEKTYNIQGSSSHSHQVALTSDNFLNLKNNIGIEIMSTSDSGHLHMVTINCAER